MAKKLSLMEDKKREEEKKKQGSVTATPSSTTKQNKVVSNAEKKQAKANAQDAKFGTNKAVTEAKDTTSKKAANENYRRANGDYTDTYKAQTATKNGTKNFSDIKKADYANAVPTLTDRLSDLKAVKPSQSTRTDGFISGITKRETPLTQEIPVLSGELKDIPKQQTSWANLDGDDFINWYESSDNVSEKQNYQTKYEQLKAQQIYQKAKSLGLDADEYIRKYPSYLTQLGSAGFSKDKLAEKDAQFRADYLEENGTYPDDSMLPSSNRGTYGDLISDFQLQTQLKKKADEVGLSKDEFNDLLSYYVQPIEAQKAQEQYKSVANDNKLGGTLLSFANNIIGSVENVGDKAGSYLKSEPMRTNSYGAIDANTAQEMRNEVSKDWGNTGQFLYGAGTSLGDMALATALGNAAGGSSAAASAISRGLMAGEKASQTMNEAVDRGLDPNQVIGEGLTSAVTTYVTEKIPMGTWESVARNGITGATSKEIAKNVAKKLMASAATEGIQEGTEDLADAIADAMIAGDKSAINQEIASYIAQGYSQAEATKMAYTNFATTVGLDSLAGALSGGAMGTFSLPGNIRLTPNTETQTNAPVATQTNAQTENLIPSLEEAIRQYDAQNNQNADLDNRVMARANQNYENAISNPLNETVQSSLGDMSIEDAQWVLDNLRANPNTDTRIIETLQSEIDNAIRNQTANNMRDRVVFDGEFISTEEAQNLLNQFEQTRNDLVSLNADTEYVDSAITSLSEQLNAVDERNRTRNRDILFPANENTNEQTNLPTVESSNGQTDVPTMEGTSLQHFGTEGEQGSVAERFNAEVPTMRQSLDLNPNADRAASRAYQNTFVNSGILDENLDNQFTDREKTHKVHHVAQSMEEAEWRVQNNPNEVFNNIMESENLDDSNSYEALALLRELHNTGNEKAEKAILQKIASQSTEAGQFLRSMREWGDASAEEQTIKTIQTIRKTVDKNHFKGYSDVIDQMTNDIVNAIQGDDVEADIAAVKDILNKTYGDYGLKEITHKHDKLKSDVAKKAENKIREVEKNSKGKPKEEVKSEMQKELERFLRKETGTADFDAPKAYEYLKQIENEIAEGKLDPESQEYRKKMARYGEIIDKSLPSSLGKKIKTIMYDNMLASFRTIFTRNIGGNAVTNSLEALSHPFTTAIDIAVSKVTGKHAYGYTGNKQLKAYMKGFKRGFQDWWAGKYETRIDENGEIIKDKNGKPKKYFRREVVDENGNKVLKKNGKVKTERVRDYMVRSGEAELNEYVAANHTEFKGDGIFSRFFRAYDDIVKQGMSLGDKIFYEGAYEYRKTELEGILNKYGPEKFAVATNIPTEFARDYDKAIAYMARESALEACLQNNSLTSQSMASIRNALGQVSSDMFGADIISQSSMPFVQVGGNLISRGIQFSPLGVVGNTARTIAEARHKAFNQERFSKEAGRNIVGFLLYAGAGALAKNGLISKGYSDDDDEKKAQQSQGYQEYALQSPDGSWQMDLSDLGPVGMAAEAAAAYNEARENNEGVIPSLVAGGGQMLESMLDDQIFQGLDPILGTSNSYSSGSALEDIVDRGAQVTGNLLGQFVPGITRNAANFSDDYKRDLGQYGTPQYTFNSILNQVPGLRQTLPVKYDNEGNPVLNYQGREGFGKFNEAFVLPYTISQPNYTDLTQKAMELSDTIPSLDNDYLEGNSIAFTPSVGRGDFKKIQGYNADEYKESDYYDFNKEYKQLNGDIGNALLDNADFNALNPMEQNDMLNDFYSAAKTIAKEDYVRKGKSEKEILRLEKDGDIYTSDSKLVEAYRENGVQGMIDYYLHNKKLEDAGLSDSKTTNKIEDLGDEAFLIYADMYNNCKDEAGKFSTDLALDYINENGIDKKTAGQILYCTVNTDKNKYGKQQGTKAIQAKNFFGDEGVVDYFTIKSNADQPDEDYEDGNGSINSKELRDYLRTMNISDADRNTWYKIFNPKSEVKPFSAENKLAYEVADNYDYIIKESQNDKQQFSAYNAVNVCDKYGLSKQDAGTIIYVKSGGDVAGVEKAKDYYKSKNRTDGYEGAYWYFYIKGKAEALGEGSKDNMSQAEFKQFMNNNSTFSQEDKRFWWDAFFPKSTGKNPY